MTRPIDRHLDGDEFEALVSPLGRSVPPSGEEESELSGHLAACPECQRKLQMYKAAQNDIVTLAPLTGTAPGLACLSEDAWLDLAAGLLPEARTRACMQHAAQCGHCGPLLRSAMDTFADDATPEEERLLTSLKSARSPWQSGIVESLRSTFRPQPGQPPADHPAAVLPQATRIRSAWPRFTFAVAAAFILCAGWFALRALRSPSADRLLAQAYTQRRTLELRMEGAAWANRHVTRSASPGESTADRPVPLIEAEALIARQLQKDSENPRGLQLRARADLLEGHPDAAVKTLQSLLEQDPNNNSVRIDLASAYFERAGALQHDADYAEAIELLEKVLHADPRNPVALFNDAVVLEKLSLFQQAIETWNRYLAIDPSSPWADEARANQLRIRQTLDEREKRSAVPLEKPGEFAREAGSTAGTSVDGRIELYLDKALESWLPQAFATGAQPSGAADARSALNHLAALLAARHDDPWLSDLLASLSATPASTALQDLVLAREALNTGRYQQSVDAARRARSAFQLAGDNPGVLWSSFALIYAQSFALHYADCSQLAGETLSQLESTRYHWLYAQTLIQGAECANGTAHLQSALLNSSSAVQIAARFGYPGLALRATSFHAAYSLDTGNSDDALRALNQGLAEFWQFEVANARAENLYSVLSDLAEARGWPHVDAFALSELLSDFPNHDPLDQAIQSQLLAAAQERAGDYTASAATLRQVDALLATLPPDPSVTIRKAEIAVQNARILLHAGDAQNALSLLSTLREHFEKTDPSQFQADYFKTCGEALLAQHRDPEAQPLLQRALQIAENYLAGLSSEAERLSWSRLQGELYRDLFAVKLRSGNASDALAWWEWYKSASLRAGSAARHSSLPVDAAPPLARYPLPPGTALLSYVVLPGQIAAFVSRDGNTRAHALPFAKDLDSLVLRFVRHCSTPTGNLALLDAESAQLYDLLVAPLESELAGATALQIETDGILDRVPFDLLHARGTPDLAERFDLSFSPGLAYTASAGALSLSAASPALVVAASSPQGEGLAALPEAAGEAADIASYFQSAKLLSDDGARRDLLADLRQARLFHFSGHATADVSSAALILGRDSVLSARDLAPLQLRSLQLAVLSGCGTANGNDASYADVNSLARTLMSAGVPRVVASRWPVDSAATRRLMRVFYAALLSGKPAAASLRAAEAALRKTPGYEHPYYWDSFAVFGSA